MFFNRKKDATKTPRAPVDLVEADLAKDTIAALLRTLGEFALPTSLYADAEFKDRCEKLALELLIRKANQDGESEEVRSPKKVHRDVRQMVREQRQVEAKEYRAHRESAHVIVANLVTSLRKELAEKEGQDSEVAKLLEDIEQVVETGDLKAIRKVTTSASKQIRQVMASQREKERENLAALSDQLRGMREELKDVRSKMQHDSLTELLNRGAFDQALEKTIQIAQAAATELTLYMIDLDRFKTVNDTHGHQAGDEVLKAVARQLIKSFPRKDDLVARFGGEEFAVVCRDVGADDAYMLGDRARRTVEKLQVEYEDDVITPTISVGYAVLNRGERADALLSRADQALYDAKRLGRNRVEPLTSSGPLGKL